MSEQEGNESLKWSKRGKRSERGQNPALPQARKDWRNASHAVSSPQRSDFVLLVHLSVQNFPTESFIVRNTHQPIKKPINLCRGEGGGEWMGGPLWSPVVPSSLPCTLEDSYPILFTDDSLRHAFTRTSTWYHPHPRATIKALPASLHPPSPLRIIRFHFGRLMPITADLSALLP